MPISDFVEVLDGVADGCFEIVDVGEGAVSEAVSLEVCPHRFDVVEFGCALASIKPCVQWRLRRVDQLHLFVGLRGEKRLPLRPLAC